METGMILVYKAMPLILLTGSHCLLSIRMPGFSRMSLPPDSTLHSSNRLITPLQTGFVQGRRISDNGFVMQTFLEHCQKHRSTGEVVQEKARARVYLSYLRAVMDFPDQFTDSIFSLFFGTNIHLNINEYLAELFVQQRGLRQGAIITPL